MDQPVLVKETPVEFFQKLVGSAITRQHVRTTEFTQYYLVNLLCRFLRPESSAHFTEDEPLAIRLGRALYAGGLDRRMRLRSLGDYTLYTAGFHSDSLKRKTIDVDYYVSMGEYAYGSLGQEQEDSFQEVYLELARKFVGFADVLADVSEQTTVRSANADVLRLYEKWLRTGSRRDWQKLFERGIVPNDSIGKKFVQ